MNRIEWPIRFPVVLAKPTAKNALVEKWDLQKKHLVDLIRTAIDFLRKSRQKRLGEIL